MRSLKGCFMLAVAFVLTLNNFFYAVNPAAAKGMSRRMLNLG